MKIYIISALNGNKFAGPSYSVPRTVYQLSFTEMIIWINVGYNYECNEEIKKRIIYINYIEYKKKGVQNIFNEYGEPEIAIFEELYNLEFCFIAKTLHKRKIPYMIVPRGCLCSDAQSKKIIKKKLANLLFFNRFIKNASCIQYLTKNEAKDSGRVWNKNYCIIPNGIDISNVDIKKNYTKPIKGIFIGRIDIFHKGLDLFISAFAEWNKKHKDNLVVDIYGSDSIGDKKKIISLINNKNLNNIIHVHGPIYDEDKKNELLSHDFFILTSRFEGHPMGLLEALSFGLPALVTEGSNMRQEIYDYNCGWTSDNSVEGIIRSLDLLYNDMSKLKEMSNNALKLARQYSWEIISEMIINQINIYK